MAKGKRKKQPSVIKTMTALNKIDRMLKSGKITKKQHDKRSGNVLKKAFVRFK